MGSTPKELSMLEWFSEYCRLDMVQWIKESFMGDGTSGLKLGSKKGRIKVAG